MNHWLEMTELSEFAKNFVENKQIISPRTNVLDSSKKFNKIW